MVFKSLCPTDENIWLYLDGHATSGALEHLYSLSQSNSGRRSSQKEAHCFCELPWLGQAKDSCALQPVHSDNSLCFTSQAESI